MEVSLPNDRVKWPEVYGLVALNVAIAISWIAYQEYQPVLVRQFSLSELGGFMIITRAMVLVFIPPIAGFIADRLTVSYGKPFIVFTVGIIVTAMVFMIVASIIGLGPSQPLAAALPVMILLWLIGMNVFTAPAHSMVEMFASSRRLPVVMGVLVLVTDLIYALEPMVVLLVRTFGEVLTFVAGGILIMGTGYIFYRLTTDEIYDRKQHFLSSARQIMPWSVALVIATTGLFLGVGRGFIEEYIPRSSVTVPVRKDVLSFMMMGSSALVAFVSGGFLSRNSILPIGKAVTISSLLMVTGVAIIIMATGMFLQGAGMVLLCGSLGVAHVTCLPYAFKLLSVRNITFGIGLFLGASEIASGLLEIYYGFFTP